MPVVVKKEKKRQFPLTEIINARPKGMSYEEYRKVLKQQKEVIKNYLAVTPQQSYIPPQKSAFQPMALPTSKKNNAKRTPGRRFHYLTLKDKRKGTVFVAKRFY